MNTELKDLPVPEEAILSKIYQIRGLKVMLDFDLSELYGVETKHLKRAVRRNIERFPSDFMFELSTVELKNWRSHFGTSNREKMGLRVKPFAFTEHGVLMLASVLNSKKAVQVNIQIVRVFVKMRKYLENQTNIIRIIEELQKNANEQDQKIEVIFEYIRQMEEIKLEEKKFRERKRIGY
jgi:phage regulator Rha-like protein